MLSTRGVLDDCKLGLACLDLTSLNARDTDEVIEKLCNQAKTQPTTAAVCVESRFISLCKKKLEGSGVRVATVVNFPYGVAGQDQIKWEIKNAVQDGADEIDIVWHYHAFLDGDEKEAVDPVQAAIAELERLDPDRKVGLKIILETSELEDKDPSLVERAGQLCLSVPGSHRITFLKTSTGKLSNGKGASLTAARALCRAIKAKGAEARTGVKVSGGVRTAKDASAYISLIAEEMGLEWVAPEKFRIGASGLWNALVTELKAQGVAAGEAVEGQGNSSY